MSLFAESSEWCDMTAFNPFGGLQKENEQLSEELDVAAARKLMLEDEVKHWKEESESRKAVAEILQEQLEQLKRETADRKKEVTVQYPSYMLPWMKDQLEADEKACEMIRLKKAEMFKRLMELEGRKFISTSMEDRRTASEQISKLEADCEKTSKCLKKMSEDTKMVEETPVPHFVSVETPILEAENSFVEADPVTPTVELETENRVTKSSSTEVKDAPLIMFSCEQKEFLRELVGARNMNPKYKNNKAVTLLMVKKQRNHFYEEKIRYADDSWTTTHWRPDGVARDGVRAQFLDNGFLAVYQTTSDGEERLFRTYTSPKNIVTYRR